MPYIGKEARGIYDMYIDPLLDCLKRQDATPGDLNYIITRLINTVYSNRNYQSYNTAIGVLECVKQELYRRKISPYEDGKIQSNGDVY